MQNNRRQTGYDYVKQVSDSQNFLTSSRLLERIVRLADVREKPADGYLACDGERSRQTVYGTAERDKEISGT